MSTIAVLLIGLGAGVLLVLLTILAVVLFSSLQSRKLHQSYTSNTHWSSTPRKRRINGGFSSDVPADVRAYVTHSHQHPGQGGLF